MIQSSNGISNGKIFLFIPGDPDFKDDITFVYTPLGGVNDRGKYMNGELWKEGSISTPRTSQD